MNMAPAECRQGCLFASWGKGRAAPSPQQPQSCRAVARLRCARTTPSDCRCPPLLRLFATKAGPMAGVPSPTGDLKKEKTP